MRPSPRSAPASTPADDLARRLSLEQTVARISRRLAAAAPGHLDAAVVATLRDLGEAVGADRSYVFCYDRDADTLSNTHEWCAPRIAPQREMLQDLPLAAFGWSVDRLERAAVLDVPRVDELPDAAAAEREILQAQDIRSLVLVRMRDGRGQVTGFIGLDAVRHDRTWQAEDADLLEIAGDIVAAARERERTLAALQASEARHRATLDAIPDLLFVLDADGHICEHQVPRDRKLAVTAELVRGTSVWEVLDRRHHRALQRALEQARRDGRSHEFRYTLETADGVGHFEARLTRRGPQEYLALVRDVTQRHEHEVALRRLALQLTSAEEEQRRQLALELHEGVQQDLSGLMYRLQALRTGDAARDRQIEALLPMVRRTVRRAQELSFDLSPPVLYELGLDAALQTLVERHDAQSDRRCTFRARGEDPGLPGGLGILLYRIAGELLENAMAHTDATQVAVTVVHTPAAVELTVQDDGHGPDPEPDLRDDPVAPAAHAGLGWFGIRQRLAPLGGTLTVETAAGTLVRATLPRERVATATPRGER